MPGRRRDSSEQPQGGGRERPQDPHVERLRADPSAPPEPVATLAGLLGDSDRKGFRRLYFTRELDYHAEVRVEDIVAADPIPSDQPPFVGLDATRLTVKRDANIEFTRLVRPTDEWDVDVTIGRPRFRPVGVPPDFLLTQGTCVTCGPACRVTLQTCGGFCGAGGAGDDDTSECSVTCGGGECPDSLAVCRFDFPWRRRIRF